MRPTSFHGLVLRKDGAILVASGDYGILRYKDGNWEQLTKDWKEGVGLCGFEVTDSDIAVLPVYELGIALYDLNSGKYSFILPDYCNENQALEPQKQ